MSQVTPYPKTESPVGAVIMTQFGKFHHTNQFSHDKADQLIEITEEGFKRFDDLNHVLGSISVLLTDIPAEPLLGASANKKGSTLGVMSVTYLLNHPRHGHQVKNIIKSGDGVIILRIHGELDLSKDILPEFETEVELFTDFPSYEKFIIKLAKDHGITEGSGGVMFS